MLKLTNRAVDRAAPRDRDYDIHDSEVPGFLLKVYPSGVKTYIYRYKNLSRVHRTLRLGRHGVVSCAQARKLARNAALAVLEGRDPFGDRLALVNTPTVLDLANAYLERCNRRVEIGTLTQTTVEQYEVNIRENILPALGQMRAADVAEEDVIRLVVSISRGRPAMAERSLISLRAMFRCAERSGLIPWGTNPATDIKKPQQRKRIRSPEPKEVARLGAALYEFEAIDQKWWRVVQLIRLLALTGRRVGEITDGRVEWIDLDARTYWIPNAKGREVLFHIPEPAVPILQAVMEDSRGSPWIFPGKYRQSPLRRPWPRWRVIRKKAGLDWMNFRHFRHLHASAARHMGYNLEMVGRILGHESIKSTQIYAHFYTDSYREAADNTASRVADWLSEDFETPGRILA